jgi:hypothetical protein
VKGVPILLLAVQAVMAQTGTGVIQGTVLDARTQKPVPIALVIANRTAAPPIARNTKSGADGAFRIHGLPPGTYALCAQAGGAQYLDPCDWNGSPTMVTLAAGQTVLGASVRLTPASVLIIQVQDAQKILSQRTRDGRRPDLTIGVWGPNGMYYPARAASAASIVNPLTGVGSYSYRVGVPRDTALQFHIASRDLRLGDAAGAALAGNTSRQSFQHATGDANPRSFAFTVLGLLP